MYADKALTSADVHYTQGEDTNRGKRRSEGVYQPLVGGSVHTNVAKQRQMSEWINRRSKLHKEIRILKDQTKLYLENDIDLELIKAIKQKGQEIARISALMKPHMKPQEGILPEPALRHKEDYRVPPGYETPPMNSESEAPSTLESSDQTKTKSRNNKGPGPMAEGLETSTRTKQRANRKKTIEGKTQMSIGRKP